MTEETNEPSKIVHLAVKQDDNTRWTPEQMVEHVLSEIRSGNGIAGKANKAIVLLLDDREGVYNHTMFVSNLRVSEMVALLTVKATQMTRTLAGA